MELSLLEPGEEYEESETATFYHGVNAYQLEGIIDHGADISKNRRESSGYDTMEAHLHEDIIRHLGSDVTHESLGDAESVRKYVQENREELLEDGSEYTQWLIEEADESLERGLHVVDNLVWVSRDKHEAGNYSARSDIAGCDKKSGGLFKFEIPEDAVLEMGVNGGVPGEIPLEYADTLFLENMETEEREEVWLDFVSNKYDVDIKSI